MKKLRCISLPKFKRNLPSITLGKIYEQEYGYDDSDDYWIIDDSGRKIYWEKYFFEEVSSDLITYQSRYSDTDEPDDMGRWARKAYYRGVCIAWISRLEINGKIIFSVNTHFPLTGSDIPNKHDIANSFEEAKLSVENLWGQFIEICK
jgi:hypothetical protein